jgi:uncharacterized protein
MRRYILAALMFGTPVMADVPTAVTDHILPGYANFTESAAALAMMAETTCAPDQLRPAWNAAFDAWLGIAHIRMGPVEA